MSLISCSVMSEFGFVQVCPIRTRTDFVRRAAEAILVADKLTRILGVGVEPHVPLFGGDIHFYTRRIGDLVFQRGTVTYPPESAKVTISTRITQFPRRYRNDTLG